MKKHFKAILVFIVFALTITVSVFGSFPQAVSAEVSSEFVNFVFTGEQGHYPYHDFDILAQTKYSNSNIYYYNRDGELTNQFRAMQDNVTSLFYREYSSAFVQINLAGEMRQLAATGRYFVSASAGLLALNDNERSKIVIYLNTNGQSVSATSELVYAGGDYSPDWVETDKIFITNADEPIIFRYTNREPSNIWDIAGNAANYLIFEPMVSFGLEIDEIITTLTGGTVSPGQLLKLNAKTFLDDIQGGALLSYYKNYHQIEWEIVEGNELASVSGSYLNVTGDSGTIKVRAKCRKNTLNDEYIYSDVITYDIDSTKHYLNLGTNFPDGVTLYGGGDYSLDETETAIFTSVKSGYSFLKYVDEEGNTIDHTVTSTGNYRALIDLDRSRTITALLVKNVRINEIIVEDKLYDKNDTATISQIVIEGLLPEHNISVESTLTAKFSSIMPGEDIHIVLSGGVLLEGENAFMYNFDSTFPETRANIQKIDIQIAANYKEKEYGDDDGILQYTQIGELLPGDSLTGALSRVQGEEIGEYEITQGTLDNPYYNIIFTSNTFKIVRRQIQITSVSVPDKVYDRTMSINLADINLTVAGNIINENAQLVYFAEFYRYEAGNQLVLFYAWIEGVESDCYEVIIPSSEIRANILPKPLTITANSQSKIYGNNDPYLSYTYDFDELLEGDSITGVLSRGEGEDVGSYRINIGTLAAENYEIIYVSADLTIVHREVKITADALFKAYGDADPILTFTLTEGSIIPGKDLGLSLKRALGEDSGEYLITIDYILNSNYLVEFTSSFFTINKRQVTINISTKDKIYDGTVQGEIIAEILNSIPQDQLSLIGLGYSIFNNSNCGERAVVYYDGNDVIIEDFSSYISGENISNYEIEFIISYTCQINRKEVIVYVSEDAILTKIYGETDAIISYNAFGLVQGELLLGNLSRTPGENVGSYTINQGTLTDDNNSNYHIIFETDELFTITKRDVKIIVDNKDLVYGEVEGEILKYLSGETPLPGGVILEDILSGNPTRESGLNHGQYRYLIGTLAIRQNVRNNYNLIFEGGYLNINKRPISITVYNFSKTYGDGDPIITSNDYEITSGMLVDINHLTFARDLGENVGSYSIYAVLSDNYDLTLTEGILTIEPADITIKANNLLKTYGNSDPSLTFVITSGILMFDDSYSTVFSGALQRESGENVGDYIIGVGSLAWDPNYNVTFINGSLTIHPRNIAVYAHAVRKFLDEQGTPEFTYDAVGLINGDVLSGELTAVGVDGLGEYDILLGSLSSENYIITFYSAKYSIVKRALYIEIDYVSREYDGTDYAELTYRVWGDIAEGDEEDLGIILSKEDGWTVGRYLISATSSNDKYDAVVYENYFEILPRVITITADDIEITYGEPVPDSIFWTYTVDGQIINNEIIVTLYRTQSYCAGTFEILGSISNANNYDVTFIPGTLTIHKKTIYVTVANYEKIYGQADPTFDYQLEEGALYNGDTLQGYITRQYGENAGVYSLICSLTNSNYNIIMNSAALAIRPKELVLVTTALDKIYDGTNIAYMRIPTISGEIFGDDVRFVYETDKLARFEDAEVGDDKLVIVYGGELVGEHAGNYYLIRPTGLTANITNSVVQDDNVSVYASKSNTRLKSGTTLVTTKIEIDENLFGQTKNIIDSCEISLMYNNQTFENYGSLTISINLSGSQQYFNVQLYKVKEDGSLEIVKSQYSNGVVTFETNSLGTYIVIADNDRWLDYTLIGVSLGILILGCSIIIPKQYKKRKNKKTV